MHIELSGSREPDAETVVLAAGLGGLGSFWLPQMRALNARYRVVIYDQRGTGRSADQLPDGYSMQDMAAELMMLLEQHAIRRFTVIGHALGGMIALQMALDFPDNVSRLVVVNGWLHLDAHTRRCFNVRQDLLLNAGVDAYIRAQPLFLYPADWISAHQTRLEAEDSLQAAHFQGSANLLKRLHALMACDFRQRAKHVFQPVLLLCSRDDLLVPWTCSPVLQAALPAATLQYINYGGHAMSVTESDDFNHRLLHWLAETRTVEEAPVSRPV